MSYEGYPDFERVKKILVIKLRHLGDTLLTSPVFRSLKEEFPAAEIHAYINDESIPMLEGNPAIDHYITYNRKRKSKNFLTRVRQEWKLLWQIRKEGYDLIINLTEGDRGCLACILSGAEIRVGFAPKNRWFSNSLTHVVKSCPSLRHTVERNLDALRRVGIFPQWDERELFFDVPAQAREFVRNKLGEDPFILIHPTSRWRFKCWPVDKMRALIGQLIEKGKKVVLSCGPDRVERESLQQICRDMDVINLGGEISLKELGALIELSELLICVDSVPFHLANALKKRVVAIFGPTSEITWGPWRNPNAQIISQKWSCRPCYQDGCGGSKVSDCLQTISVSRVLDACFLKPEIFSKIGSSSLSIREELILGS